MTSNERSFPWDDHNGDREYSSDEFAEFFSTLFKPGIVATANFGSGLQITESASLGMRVKFGAGEAFSSFGRNYVHDKDEEVTVPIASTLQDRTDSVAIQFNKSQREAFFVYKESDVTVTRTDSIFELQIAKILVPKNSTQITNANITDMRANESVCGYFSPHGKLNAGDITAQFKSELEANGILFSQWFETIKDQLSEDAAGHLQNQLNSLDSKVYTAYANSADGTDRFTTVYPNLNLLKGTRVPISLTGKNETNQREMLWQFDNGKNVQNQDLSVGDTLTCTFDWAVTNPTSGTFLVQLNESNWHYLSETISITSENKSGHSEFSFAVDSSFLSGIANGVQARIDNLPTDSGLTISNFLFTKGSTATLYMPSASEAKTADYPQYKYVGRMTGLNVANKNDPKNYKWQRNTDVVRDQNGDTIFENVEVTGAITQPYISTSFSIGYGLSVTAKRVGNLVTITFRGSNTTTLGSGASPTEKIPLGYRPIEAESVDCLVQGRHLDTYYYFNPDGSISYPGETVPVNSFFRGVRSYFTNDPWPALT